MTPAQEMRQLITALVAAGRRKGTIADALGVTAVTLSRWLAQAKADDGEDVTVPHQQPNEPALRLARTLRPAAA